MDELINSYAREITEKLRDNLDALVLVGSFARGEGIKGISDIEFWAVVKDLSIAKKPNLGENVSLGFTTRNHLKKLKPYIYTVEVKKFGKVLSGDADILKLIPDYAYEAIAPIDGFILLNNRIVEQLILLSQIESNQAVYQYQFDKGYIQLVNVLLTLHKRYRSLYPEKIKEFYKIYKDANTGFLNNVEKAFTSAGRPSSEAIAQKEAISRWYELREYFKKVWVEEIGVGKVKYWLNLLASGKLYQFFVYRKAAALYFSDQHADKEQSEAVIEQWKKRIK